MLEVKGDEIIGDTSKFKPVPTSRLRWYAEEGYVRLQQWWQNPFSGEGEWREIPLISDNPDSAITIKLVVDEDEYYRHD